MPADERFSSGKTAVKTKIAMLFAKGTKIRKLGQELVGIVMGVLTNSSPKPQARFEPLWYGLIYFANSMLILALLDFLVVGVGVCALMWMFRLRCFIVCRKKIYELFILDELTLIDWTKIL